MHEWVIVLIKIIITARYSIHLILSFSPCHFTIKCEWMKNYRKKTVFLLYHFHQPASQTVSPPMAPQRHCQSVIIKKEENQIHRYLQTANNQIHFTVVPWGNFIQVWFLFFLRKERKNEVKALHHYFKSSTRTCIKLGQ